MSDYIRREDAIKAVHEEFDDCVVWDESGERTADEVESIIDRVLSADVVPVVHAYWIPQKENHEFKEALINCSACGYPVSRWTGNTNFCPNCGAKMDGKKRK